MLVYSAAECVSVSSACIIDGLGSRFFICVSTLVTEKTSEELKYERRAAARTKHALDKAANLARAQRAAVVTKALEDAECASMGLSLEQTIKLREMFTKPRAVDIDGFMVAPVPNDRAIVLDRIVLENLRAPLEQSVENQRAALAEKAQKRKPAKRKRRCPDTARGGDCLSISRQLHEDEKNQDKERAETERKRARRDVARSSKSALDLRAAMEKAASKDDPSKLSLPNLKALITWRGGNVPDPLNGKSKPDAIQEWMRIAPTADELRAAVATANEPACAQDSDDDSDSDDSNDDDDS